MFDFFLKQTETVIATLNGLIFMLFDYFDQIYYELGNLELADKNESQAIVEYSNCLRSKNSDLNIRSLTYLALADLYFKKQDYLNAQVYYDSSARSTDKNSPEYTNINAKNQILNELIKHLLNIKEKDSLLKLADNKKLMEKFNFGTPIMVLHTSFL